MTVSVIVPVFNVDNYLRRGIDSILSQSYQDFELILVDDGSLDDSGAICDEFAAKDIRIRVIHKVNGGVSSARNEGLDRARGEWVYFMDPDDYLYPDCLSTLASGISEDVDVVMGGYEEIDLDGTPIREIQDSSERKILDKSNSLRPLFAPYSPEFGYVGHSWLRLYRMEVIREHHIRFNDSVAIREGTLFNAAYLCLSRGTTCFIQKPIYKYYHRESSAVISLNKGFNRKLLTSFDANVQILHYIKDSDLNDRVIIRCAKEEVMDRYRGIKRYMLHFDVKNEKILRGLRIRCIYELGIPFVVSYLSSWAYNKYIKKIVRAKKGRDE